MGWGRSSVELVRAVVNRLAGWSALVGLGPGLGGGLGGLGGGSRLSEFFNCLAPPQTEYQFPRDLFQ